MKVLSIDIGGTNIKYKTISDIRDTADYNTIPTPHSFSDICNVLQNIINSNSFDKIVISVPGVYDYEKEVVVFAPNTPISNQNIIRQLKTDKPIIIENDAKLAAIGEYQYGFNKRPDSMVFITLGTGVGGAFILNGKNYRTKTTSFELGHMTIMAGGRLCGCGKRGCIEKYCSTSGIIETYKEISELKTDVTLKDIISLANNKNNIALRTFEIFAEYLAHAISSLINLLTPEAIRIGGGLSELEYLYFKHMQEYLNNIIFPAYKNSTDVSIAKYRNSAAIIGGLALASES